MLSTRLVMVTGTVVLGFDTVAVNVKSPPGATRLVGLAVFVNPICGPAGGGVRLTLACAVAVTVIPFWIPVTVTVSVWASPALPVNGPENVHGPGLAPGANVTPMNDPHVLPGSPARSP